MAQKGLKTKREYSTFFVSFNIFSLCDICVQDQQTVQHYDGRVKPRRIENHLSWFVISIPLKHDD